MRSGHARFLARVVAVPAVVMVGATLAKAQDAREPSQLGIAGTPWVVDGRVGVPRAKSGDDFRLSGALTLGYWAEDLGALASGDAFTYAFTDERGSSDSSWLSGSARGFWRSGRVGAPLRVDLGVRANASLITTTSAPQNPSPQNGYFRDEDSVFGRGALEVGLRWEPSTRFWLAGRAGGGLQYESYGYVSTDPADNTLLDSDEISGAAHGDLKLGWVSVPDLFGVRTSVGLEVFELTRSEFAVGPASAVAVSETVKAFTQIELRSRLTLDLLIAQFVGIAPFTYVGLDWLSLRGASGARSESIPSAGVGLATPFE